MLCAGTNLHLVATPYGSQRLKAKF